MNESDVINLIRKVIRQEMSPIVMGQMVSNETESRSTIKRLGNEGPRKNIRSIMPFGFASKAPANTQAFIVPAGNDPTNQNILGHFDEGNRPALDDGDVALYDAFGNIFKISNGKFQLGSETSSQNLVLGPALMSFLGQFLDLVANHTHPGIGSPPSNAANFESLKSSPVEDNSLLSQKSFTE